MSTPEWMKLKPEDLPPRGVCHDCGDPAVHHYAISGFGRDIKPSREWHFCHPCDERRRYSGPAPLPITPKDPPSFIFFPDAEEP